MSNIVISGYYGFGNAGDEAMLCAIIDAIRKEEADAHITVISGNPTETSKSTIYMRWEPFCIRYSKGYLKFYSSYQWRR